MRVVILRGISGSGKSTVTEQLAKECTELVVVCSADDYFIDNEKYTFDSTKLGVAHLACFNKFTSAITNGDDLVIVDNTNTRLWEISPYIMFAKANMIDADTLEVIRCECSITEAYNRNIHNVPYKTLDSMSKSMQSLLPHWPSEMVVNTGTENN